MSDHGPEHHEDHGGLAKYVYVFIALCVLTTMSFFTYSVYWPFHSQPRIGWAFMMAVSCTKAMLVILFFMHVKYEANWKYVLTLPCAVHVRILDAGAGARRRPARPLGIRRARAVHGRTARARAGFRPLMANRRRARNTRRRRMARVPEGRETPDLPRVKKWFVVGR